MAREIRITKRSPARGEDGHKVISVRMKDATVTRLDELAALTNRSRNELINILLETALNNVTVEDE